MGEAIKEALLFVWSLLAVALAPSCASVGGLRGENLLEAVRTEPSFRRGGHTVPLLLLRWFMCDLMTGPQNLF